ncbi:hypothetical protein BJX99DRAFT_222245 [Aspergillus californicus]
MPSSSETTLNWDFTPVINLLRSPTRSTDLSPSDRPLPPTPLHDIAYDAENSVIKGNALKDANTSSSELGDFGGLWELLGNTSPSSSLKGREPYHEPQPSKESTKSVTILKRPSNADATVAKASTVRTALKPISILSRTNAHSSSRLKADTEPHISDQQRGRRGTSSHEPTTSENDAGAESDLSVFDPPLFKPQSIPPMIPPQVGFPEVKTGSPETPPSSFEESDEFLTPNAIKQRSRISSSRLLPLVYKNAAEQRVGLLTKLLKNFPDYAELLVQAGRSTKPKSGDISSRPIHVFVDMSNISVGFHDTMKYSRNIPVKTRIRRVPISFQNFSLILERGRPAAKRVLVGSDRFAAITQGEQLGYEANILDRVQKIKQPTPRQLKFRRNPRAAQYGGHSSETNDVLEERWVEQGVDEILHLKILESLLDDEPATIVLATGDAAEAEYSGGFMKMVERALQRGWKVELVSFTQVTSHAYRKKEFLARWGDQFQVVALDDFIEDLLEI